MLAHLLAIAVALGSFGLYFSAFLFPEVHRKSDFYWSGLGLFYALVLWVCAGRITGGVLLGQMASVALLLWFGPQTVMLRRLLASPEEKTNISQAIASPFQFLSPKTLWQKITGGNQQPTPSSQSETSSKSTSRSQHPQGEPSETTSPLSSESQSQQEQEKSTELSRSETSSTLSSESQQQAEAETTDSPNNPTEERSSNQKGSASSSDSQ